MKKSTLTSTSEVKFKSLRRFNLIMGFLHLIQGIFMIVISNDTTYPLTTTFPSFDPVLRQLVPAVKNLGELLFGPAVAVFLLLSAIAHFYLSTIGYKRYVENLKKGMNPIRFYEYALSSSWMIVLIAMLIGMWDITSLVLLFSVNATMNLFGIMMEYHNQYTERVNWTSFIYGVFAGIMPWVAMGIYFVTALQSSDARPPAFVYAIVASIFIFFNIFAVNMVLQYKKVGRWKDYLFGERVYIILSLLAKTALAWQIFAGTLAPV